MGCPDAITGHLAGLQDVSAIDFDISKRTFAMTCERFSRERLQSELDTVSIKEKRNFAVAEYWEINK